MANLNFQQPPRSIGSGGLGSGSRGGSSSGSSNSFSSSQAAPGTASQATAASLLPTRSTLFAQRAFADGRRAAPAALPNSTPVVAVRGSLRGVLGGDGPGAPPLLDPSEFPSLTARGQEQPHHHIPPPGSKPYVGMVKQPTAEQSEFTMSSEDFPALPGTNIGTGGAPSNTIGGSNTTNAMDASATNTSLSNCNVMSSSGSTNDDSDAKQHGVKTTREGQVSNIPRTMVANQFGIVGLLTFIRAAETDPELVSLALGQDLTTLGLNLNSPDNLYLTFAGPWADASCRPQDIDYNVPPEYLINSSIREKLAPLKLNRYKDDLLFYLFYCFVGDILQMAAASELYNREWRYHTEEKVWITQAPGLPTLEKTTTYERGTYFYFDAHNWRKVAKEFHLDYSKLEGRPQLPSSKFHA